MPTRDEVARLAHVSTATVSRCYNAPHTVAASKREAVFKAAQKLHYVPDKNASALRRAGSGVIGFIEESASYLAKDRNYSWLYAELIAALKTVFNNSLYHFQLFTVDKPEQLLTLAKNRLCDGFILHDIHNRKIIDAAKTCGLPVVAAWRENDRHLNTVGLDEVEGGRMVARHLKSRGLTRPAHITAMLKKHPACIDRFKGFQEIFSDSDIPVVDQEFGIQGGYASAKAILPLIKAHKIDSIFVVNDVTALGVIQALQEAHLSVPGDVSLIGYGNNPILDTLSFKLTTMDERMGAIYEQAAETVLRLLKAEAEPSHIRVSPLLIEGNSVRLS